MDRGGVRLLYITPSYLVVYKPPCLHSVPLREGEGGTLLDIIAETCPDVRLPQGRKALEGGLLHRLDYETRGLLLAARSQEALDRLKEQQEQGLFIKEYQAFSRGAASTPPGFPPCPFSAEQGALIESAFRPYGTGRKAVRPLAPGNGKQSYRTEIVFRGEKDGGTCFRLRLTRGFRHHIRCHLAWAGFPIANDALYGGASDGGHLALAASLISFIDPGAGKRVEYSL